MNQYSKTTRFHKQNKKLYFSHTANNVGVIGIEFGISGRTEIIDSESILFFKNKNGFKKNLLKFSVIPLIKYLMYCYFLDVMLHPIKLVDEVQLF
jgi:hypothetical protein